MVSKEKEDVVDLAWRHLHNRLEEDGLLSGRNQSKRFFRQTISFKWMVAAVILLLGVLSGLYMMRSKGVLADDLLVLHNQTHASTLATMLEDGSVVYLSGQTSLHYPDRFADHRREVMLQGEAFFEISKQAERPFIIDTDVATVEVVGTSFSVKSGGHSSFLLSVRDGMVRVALKQKQQIVSVRAGETVLLDSDRLEVIKTSGDRFDKYVRRIHFKDERLENITRIVNMHSDSLQLEVAPGLEGRSLTFTTPENDPAIIAELICLALNLEYSQQENIIYISQQE